MNTLQIRAACAAALAWVAGCAAPPAVNRTPRTVALILSGDVVSYSSQGLAARIRIVEVDGKPAAEPYGPVSLAPGRHAVTLACDGANTPHMLTVAAGEIYQFVARVKPGVKGCTGALSRVRSTNP